MDTDFLCTQAIGDDPDETFAEESDEERREFGTLKVLPNKKLGIPSIEFPIFHGENTLGRHTECAMAIPWSLALSKKHAIIEVDQGTCFICDCGSSNKTRLNKVILKPNIKYGLRDADEIVFGDVRCIFSQQIVNCASPSRASTSVTPNHVKNKPLAADTPDNILGINIRVQTALNESTTSLTLIPDSQPASVETPCPRTENHPVQPVSNDSPPPFDLDETMSDVGPSMPSAKHGDISRIDETDSDANTDYHMDSDTDIEDNLTTTHAQRNDGGDSDATDLYEADTIELKSEQNSEVDSGVVHHANDVIADDTKDGGSDEEVSLLGNVDSEQTQRYSLETITKFETANGGGGNVAAASSDDEAILSVDLNSLSEDESVEKLDEISKSGSNKKSELNSHIIIDKPGCSKFATVSQQVLDTIDDSSTQAFPPAVIQEEDEDVPEYSNMNLKENIKTDTSVLIPDTYDDLCTQDFSTAIQEEDDNVANKLTETKQNFAKEENSTIVHIPDTYDDICTQAFPPAFREEGVAEDPAACNDTMDMLATQAFFGLQQSESPAPVEEEDYGSDADSEVEDSMLFNMATQAFAPPMKINSALKNDDASQRKMSPQGGQSELPPDENRKMQSDPPLKESVSVNSDIAKMSQRNTEIATTSSKHVRNIALTRLPVSSQESINDTEPFDTEPYVPKATSHVRNDDGVPQLLPTSETTVLLAVYSSHQNDSSNLSRLSPMREATADKESISMSKVNSECLEGSAMSTVAVSAHESANEMVDDEETQAYIIDEIEDQEQNPDAAYLGDVTQEDDLATQAYVTDVENPILPAKTIADDVDNIKDDPGPDTDVPGEEDDGSMLENDHEQDYVMTVVGETGGPAVPESGSETGPIEDVPMPEASIDDDATADEEETQGYDVETIGCGDIDSTVPLVENIGAASENDGQGPTDTPDLPVEDTTPCEISPSVATDYKLKEDDTSRSSAKVSSSLESGIGSGSGGSKLSGKCYHNIKISFCDSAFTIDRPIGEHDGKCTSAKVQNDVDTVKTQAIPDSEDTEIYEITDINELRNQEAMVSLESHLSEMDANENAVDEGMDKSDGANLLKPTSGTEGLPAITAVKGDPSTSLDNSTGQNDCAPLSEVSDKADAGKACGVEMGICSGGSEAQTSSDFKTTNEKKKVNHLGNADDENTVPPPGGGSQIDDGEVEATQSYISIRPEPVKVSSNVHCRRSTRTPRDKHGTMEEITHGKNIHEDMQATQAYVNVSDVLPQPEKSAEIMVQSDFMESTQANVGLESCKAPADKNPKEKAPASLSSQTLMIREIDTESTQCYVKPGALSSTETRRPLRGVSHPKEGETATTVECSNVPTTSSGASNISKNVEGSKVTKKKSAPTKRRQTATGGSISEDVTETRRSRRASKKMDYAAVASGKIAQDCDSDIPGTSTTGRGMRSSKRSPKQEPLGVEEAPLGESCAMKNGGGKQSAAVAPERKTRSRVPSSPKSQQAEVKTEPTAGRMIKVEQTHPARDAASLSSGTSTRTAAGRKRKNSSVGSAVMANVKRPAKKVKSEEETDDDSELDLSRALRPRKEKPKVMFTGVMDDVAENIVQVLGGQMASDIQECTHLVTDKMRRTIKFLCAVVRGIHILTPKWLHRSGKCGRFLPEEDFLLTEDTCSPDGESLQIKHSFSLHSSVEAARRNIRPLFSGLRMFVTNNVVPTRDQMNQILKCAGAEVFSKMPTVTDETAEGYVIVASPRDKRACMSAIQAGCRVVSNEFVLTGVLRHEVDFGTHALFGTGAQKCDPSPHILIPENTNPTVPRVPKTEVPVCLNTADSRSQDSAASVSEEKAVLTRRSVRSGNRLSAEEGSAAAGTSVNARATARASSRRSRRNKT